MDSYHSPGSELEDPNRLEPLAMIEADVDGGAGGSDSPRAASKSSIESQHGSCDADDGDEALLAAPRRQIAKRRRAHPVQVSHDERVAPSSATNAVIESSIGSHAAALVPASGGPQLTKARKQAYTDICKLAFHFFGCSHVVSRVARAALSGSERSVFYYGTTTMNVCEAWLLEFEKRMASLAAAFSRRTDVTLSQCILKFMYDETPSILKVRTAAGAAASSLDDLDTTVAKLLVTFGKSSRRFPTFGHVCGEENLIGHACHDAFAGEGANISASSRINMWRVHT